MTPYDDGEAALDAFIGPEEDDEFIGYSDQTVQLRQAIRAALAQRRLDAETEREMQRVARMAALEQARGQSRVDTGAQDRRNALAAQIDTAPDQQFLSWPQYMEDVGYEGLSPEQQQDEYDYYLNKVIPRFSYDDNEQKSYQQEFSKAVRRPIADRDKSDTRRWIEETLGVPAGRVAAEVGSIVPRAGLGITGLSSALQGGMRMVGLDLLPESVQRALFNGYTLAEINADTKDRGNTLKQSLSVEQQAGAKDIENAEGFVDTAKALLSNPMNVAGAGIESIPMMLGGQAVGAGALAARGVPLAQASAKQLLTASALGEGALTAGSVANDIYHADPTSRLKMYLGVPAGVVTGLISRATGGIEGRALAQAAGNKAAFANDAEQGLLRSLGTNFVKEGVIEEGPQSVNETIWTNLGTGKPWDAGLGSAYAEGTIVGGTAGAGLGLMTRNRGQQQPGAPAPTPPSSGLSPAEFEALQRQITQDHQTVSDIVDQTVNENPLESAAPVDVAPNPADGLTDRLVQLARKSTNQRNYFWELGATIETTPDDQRATAYTDVLDQIETRLESERNHSMFKRLEQVKEAILDAQANDTVVQGQQQAQQQQQQELNEVHSMMDMLTKALAVNPVATNAISVETMNDPTAFGVALLDIIEQEQALRPTSQSVEATEPPAPVNPMLQVERPDEAVAFQRQQNTRSVREQVMDQMFSQRPDPATIIDQYHAALQANGITDTQLQPAEVQRLQRYTAIAEALDNAARVERIRSSDPTENAVMESLIAEAAQGEAQPTSQTAQEYTASLSAEQMNFVKAVIRESVTRGVPISRARDELLQAFDQTGDTRLTSLRDVDFTNIYKLGQMTRQASKAISRANRPENFFLTPTDGTGTALSRMKSVQKEAVAAVPDKPQEEYLTQRQARARISAALVDSGIYENMGGAENLRADVNMLMSTLDIMAVGDSYSAADVQDVIDSWPEFLGGSNRELAMFEPGLQVYDNPYRTMPLMTTVVTETPIVGFPPDQAAAVRAIMNYAASLFPAGAFDSISRVMPLRGPTNLMGFKISSRTIGINPARVQSLVDRGMNGEDMRLMVGTMIHELAHALDAAVDGGLKSKYMQELGVGFEQVTYTTGGEEQRVVQVVGHGAVAKQIIEAWASMEDDGHFNYPLATPTFINDDGQRELRSPEIMQAELFAQITALYFGNPQLLARVSPLAMQLMENTYGDGSDFVATEAKLRGQVSYESASRTDSKSNTTLFGASGRDIDGRNQDGPPGGLGEQSGAGLAALGEEVMIRAVRKTADGKYLGAPEGAETEKGVRKLIRAMDKLLDHKYAMYSVSKDWYPASHDAVKAMFPNDEAKQEIVFRLLAVYSQANSLGANVTAVVKSMADIANGETPARGRFPNKTAALLPEMLKARTLDKTVPGVNDKIMSFYRNLKHARDGNGQFSRESTIDRWMLRLFGYTDMEEYRTKKDGTQERVATAASPAQYEFSRALVDRLTAERSAKTGEQLMPHQIQAALWTYVKNLDNSVKWAAQKKALEVELRELRTFVKANRKYLAQGYKLVPGMADDVARVVAANKRMKIVENSLNGKYKEFEPSYADYSDYFVRNMATSTMEMTPHEDTGVLANLSKLPSDVQLLYTMTAQDILFDDMGNDRVIDAIFGGQGLDGDAKKTVTGINRDFEVGTFEGNLSHNDTAQLILAKSDKNKLPDEKMHAYVSAIGYIYNQAAAAWHRIDPKGKTYGVVLKFPTTPTNEQITDLYALLRQEMPGLDLSKVGPELRALNFTGASDQQFNAAIAAAIEKFDGADFIQMRPQRFVTGYIKNDWRTHKDGEVYLDQISALGRPELVTLVRELRAAVDAHNREFAKQFPAAGSPDFSPRREPTRAEPQGVLFHAGSNGTVSGYNGQDLAFYAHLTNPSTGDFDVYTVPSGSLTDPSNRTNVNVMRGLKNHQVIALFKQGGYSRQIRTKASGAPVVTAPNSPLSSLVDLTSITDDAAKKSNKLLGAGSKSAVWTRELARAVVDQEEALERLEDVLRDIDPQLADEHRLFSQVEGLRSGIVERTEREKRKFADPFIEKLKELNKAGITMADVDNYIWSLVTPYRNAIVFERSDGEVRDGAGQTNAQAMQTIRDFEARGLGQKLQEAADLYFKMMNRQLEINLEFGLDSAEQKAKMEHTYTVRDLKWEKSAQLITAAEEKEIVARGWDKKRAVPYYAPMKTFVDTDGLLPQTTNSAGAKKFALGRSSKPDSPSVYGFEQFYGAVARGMQNRFKQNVMATARQFNDAKFWIVDEIPVVEYLDQDTGLIRRGVDPNYRSQPEVMSLRVGGDVHTVKFLAPEFVKILGNKAFSPVERTKIGEALIMISSTMMHLMSATHTAFNPDFWLVNLTRDAQGAILNAPEDAQKKFVAAYVKQLMNPETWNDASKYAWSDTSLGKQRYDSTSAEWNEFAQHGGKVSYSNYLQGFERQSENLNRLVNPTLLNQTANAGRDAMNLLTGVGETMDNAVRFAAYKAARSAGFTPQQAASIAKNATVNFERKGSMVILRQLYMFFNATVQGTYNTGRAIVRSRITQGAVLGLFIMGLVAGLVGHSGGDDEDETLYGKVPDYVRDKKLMWTHNGVAIPLPQGFNFFYALGNSLSDYLKSKRPDKARRAVTRAASAFIGAFLPNNPPKADSFAEFVAALATPEMLKPVVNVAQNKDSFGRDIIPKRDADKNIPDFQKGLTKASEWSKTLTQGLHQWGVDVSPATVDYVVKHMSGSVGSFTRRAMGTDTNPASTPIVGKFLSPGANDFELTDNVKRAIRDLRSKGDWASTQLAKDLETELQNTSVVRGISPSDPEYKRRLTEKQTRLKQLMSRYNKLESGATK